MRRARLSVLIVVLLTGCSTYSAVRYSPMAETDLEEEEDQ
jgi:hypothetical protein